MQPWTSLFLSGALVTSQKMHWIRWCLLSSVILIMHHKCGTWRHRHTSLSHQTLCSVLRGGVITQTLRGLHSVAASCPAKLIPVILSQKSPSYPVKKHPRDISPRAKTAKLQKRISACSHFCLCLHRKRHSQTLNGVSFFLEVWAHGELQFPCDAFLYCWFFKTFL